MTETMTNAACEAIAAKAMRHGNQIVYQDDEFVSEMEKHGNHIDVLVHRWFVVDDVDKIDEIERKLMTKEARRFHEKGMVGTIMSLSKQGYKADDNLRPIPCIDYIVYREGHNLALLVQHVNFQFEKEV